MRVRGLAMRSSARDKNLRPAPFRCLMYAMKLNHPHALALTLLAGSIAPLLFVLVAQYIFHLPPCHFCLLQRYPYLLVALCGALLLRHPQHAYMLTALAIIGWLTTGGIGLYHTGIEQGWIAYGGGCVADTKLAASLEELRAQITAAPRVSCNDPMGVFLWLSMASWNAISAMGWIALTLYVYRKRQA
jgi:disulfide bond formation protein DsbB